MNLWQKIRCALSKDRGHGSEKVSVDRRRPGARANMASADAQYKAALSGLAQAIESDRTRRLPRR